MHEYIHYKHNGLNKQINLMQIDACSAYLTSPTSSTANLQPSQVNRFYKICGKVKLFIEYKNTQKTL